MGDSPDLVARRLKYIQRQIALDARAVRGYSKSAEPWFNDRYSTD